MQIGPGDRLEKPLKKCRKSGRNLHFSGFPEEPLDGPQGLRYFSLIATPVTHQPPPVPLWWLVEAAVGWGLVRCVCGIAVPWAVEANLCPWQKSRAGSARATLLLPCGGVGASAPVSLVVVRPLGCRLVLFFDNLVVVTGIL